MLKTDTLLSGYSFIRY